MRDPAQKVTETDLKLVLADIFNGYSTMSSSLLGDELLYIKHLSIFDNIRTDKDYADALKIAKDKKLPTEADQADYLEKEEIWTQKDEARITELKMYISNLKETKTKLFLKSQIEPIAKDIEESSIKLLKLMREKDRYLGFTAESYATKRSNEFYIQQSLFLDKSFKDLAIDDEAFNELSDEELSKVTQSFNLSTQNLHINSLKKISLMPFFCNYFYLCDDNPMTFYGKPVVALSFYQAELFAYGRYFKNLVQESKGSPPDEIKNDPEKLVEFYEMRKTADEVMEKLEQQSGEKTGASSLVGATAEDLEAIGYKKGTGKTVDLAELAEAKGGTLSMDDFMDLHG
jgi:hypothetical protein